MADGHRSAGFGDGIRGELEFTQDIIVTQVERLDGLAETVEQHDEQLGPLVTTVEGHESRLADVEWETKWGKIQRDHGALEDFTYRQDVEAAFGDTWRETRDIRDSVTVIGGRVEEVRAELLGHIDTAIAGAVNRADENARYLLDTRFAPGRRPRGRHFDAPLAAPEQSLLERGVNWVGSRNGLMTIGAVSAAASLATVVMVVKPGMDHVGAQVELAAPLDARATTSTSQPIAREFLSADETTIVTVAPLDTAPPAPTATYGQTVETIPAWKAWEGGRPLADVSTYTATCKVATSTCETPDGQVMPYHEPYFCVEEPRNQSGLACLVGTFGPFEKP